MMKVRAAKTLSLSFSLSLEPIWWNLSEQFSDESVMWT
jgi:hypothetical protein